MPTVKEKIIQIVKEQPEDSNFDEILQELSFIRMVNKGLDDSENNKITKHEKLKKEMENW
jgi:hypothetical protein